MNYGEYYRKFKDNPAKAYAYKKANVPKKMYKYMSLENKYNEKIDNLLNNKLWLSNYQELNDPYECHNLFLDIEYLKEYGWSDNCIKNCQHDYQEFRKNFLIGSLTSNFDSNMPLWAHYANNHRGICIEYEVTDSSWIYPVTYENQRIEATNSIIKFLTTTLQERLSKVNSNNDDIFIMTLQPCMKHYSWSYEKEYRVIKWDLIGEKTGVDILLSEIGLKITAIYLGYNISDNHKWDIVDVARKLGVDIFRMEVDNENAEFQLVSTKLEIN